MNNLQKKIIVFFESLSNRNRLILLIALLTLLVFFYVVFIDGNYRGNDINYRKNDLNSIVSNSTVIYDRDKILALDEIVDNILKIKSESWTIDTSFISLDKLYSKTLTDNYKSNLSKGKFKKKMNAIYSNVLGEENYNEKNNYIKLVYYSPEYDTYLIELKSLTETKSYIGIRVINNKYVITYVE